MQFSLQLVRLIVFNFKNKANTPNKGETKITTLINYRKIIAITKEVVVNEHQQ